MTAPGTVLWLVVPALNEAANMPRLAADVRAAFARLPPGLAGRFLLVDDGSDDGTAEEARRAAHGLDLEVLRHPVRRGPGVAFATAFARLAPELRDEDWVVTCEGDNTSRLELLDQMLTRTREGFDVVLASPYMYGGGIVKTSLVRVVLSHFANGFVKEALGIHGILTLSSFYRLYRGSMVRGLQAAYTPGVVEMPGFECAVEALMKLVFLGASLSEVAMVLDTSRRAGQSKMRITRTGLGYLRLWRERGRWEEQARAARAGASRAAHP